MYVRGWLQSLRQMGGINFLVLRDVIAGIIAHLNESYAAELELLRVVMPVVPETIPHIHFADAQELILQRHGVDVRGEPDLSPQDERWLGEGMKTIWQH